MKTLTTIQKPDCDDYKWKVTQTLPEAQRTQKLTPETWTKLGNNMAPLALIANLATRWRHLTFSHLITFPH